MEIAIALALGLIVGSFLNVCILRMPKDESIVFPSSHCMSCQKAIAGYDNIPVLSFLILGGKCRHCKTKISWQYPLIELTSGILFVMFYQTFGLTPKGLLYLYLALILLVQTLIDLRYQIIPDQLTLPAIVIGLAASTAFPDIHGQATRVQSFWASLIGLLAGGGFLYLAGTIAEKILKKEAMGGGDVKLLAAIGAVIGWQGVLWTIFASSLTGSIAGIYARIKRGDELIPYGPFLALGAFTYLFFGPAFMEWYFNYLRGVLKRC